MFARSSLVFAAVYLLGSLQDVRPSDCPSCASNNPEFTPSTLVVKYRDRASAVCHVCEECRKGVYDLENAMGNRVKDGSLLLWNISSMDSWSTDIMCYYENSDTGGQCCSRLPIIVYQLPDAVSLSFVNHTGPMLEGDQYTLQCEVKNVAPVANLIVTFFRGQTELSRLRSSNTEKEPVNETFTVNITPSKDDDGAQYRCEAKLQLGPEGPKPAPAVTSDVINATVHYKPRLVALIPSAPVTLTEGETLELDCSAVGNPDPSYIWTIPSHAPSPGDSNNFTLMSVTSEHSGQYTCIANNTVGNVTVTIEVKVNAHPVNYMIYIIAGAIIGAALLGFVGVFLYIHYYKQNRTGKYNLLNVLRLRKPHSAVPTSE